MLLDKVKKKEPTKVYRVDEIAKKHVVEVLRLPPYHPDLNPIERVWAYQKVFPTINMSWSSINHHLEPYWQRRFKYHNDQVCNYQWLAIFNLCLIFVIFCKCFHFQQNYVAKSNDAGNLTLVKKLMVEAKKKVTDLDLWPSYVRSILKVEDE